MIAAAPEELEELLLQEIDKKLLMAYNEKIASVIRLSGTEEEAASFAYVQRQLEEFGIETEMYYSDAYISLPQSACMTVNGETVECITHSMAVSTAGTEGELVYAGDGVPFDDPKLDVKGKIVLMNGLAMDSLVKNAQDRGAAAVVFINAEYTHEMIASRVWGSPGPEDWALLPRVPIVSVTVAAGEILKERMRNGNVNVCLQTRVDSRWRKIPTLIGTITGAEEPERFLLLSSHVDSWHYGAMDNGAANAAVMEVVRILSKHRRYLRRSVRIAFWSGHSHGRYAGSTWYCDTFFEDLYDHCFLHINADSLGAKGSRILTEANAMAETRGLAFDVIKQLTGQLFRGTRYGRAGDQSFWGTGTPSLYMGLSEQELTPGLAAEAFSQLFGGGKTGGFGWWWHTTEDTIDKIDEECLVRDCAVYLLSVYRACAGEILPINQVAAIEELEQMIKGYAVLSGDKVDLSLMLSRVSELKREVAAVYENKEAYGREPFNQYIVGLSQMLVPLNYLRGSIYEHDLAVRQRGIPLLTEVAALEDLDPGNDQYKAMMVIARRRINQVNHTLRNAIDLTRSLRPVRDTKELIL
ncbi:MAG TPA: M28 family peptidase [Patescibacteria group bacterium]|nr:M28 family peptidase [Patescibacteria group bacterium]